MIKLIVGNKGSGKTKTLISMANEAVKSTDGNVVFVEKGLKLTYDVDHKARLVDVDHYGISGYDAYFGFLSGLLAGNYDITDIFCDSTLRVGGNEYEALAAMVDRLAALTNETSITVSFSLSCELEDLPTRIRKYAI